MTNKTTTPSPLLVVGLDRKVISHLRCTYDNPATMARECWQDGKLLCKYNAELFFLPAFPVPPSKFFFGANIGKWITGQMVGDSGALKGNTMHYRNGREAKNGDKIAELLALEGRT